MNRKIIRVVDFPDIHVPFFREMVFSTAIMRLTLAAGSPQNAPGWQTCRPVTVEAVNLFTKEFLP
jgi:hypothetical protein